MRFMELPACFYECFTNTENVSNLAENFLMRSYLQSFLLR